MAQPPTLDELFIAGSADPWATAGFTASGDTCEVGSVRLRFGGDGRGILAWSVRDVNGHELDGLDTRASAEPPAAGGPHPNGTLSIDHLVVISPDLDRTADTLRDAGFDFRRLREGDTPGGSQRQAFFRMGEVLLEVVEAPAGTKIAADPSGPARLWGISFLVDELETPAAVLGDALGEPRDAVQPGRRIATVATGAGLGPAVAFMTPGPGAA
jgi:Glyoxalase/Bleomycin resistance protein/Dioxygenase superfamily